MATDEDRVRYATIGSAFLAKVAQRLATIRPEELRPGDLAHWVDIAVKLQAAGSSERYDRTARLAEMQDFPPIQTDERLTWG